MSTKDKLLALLEENHGVYFSGEDLAARFAVSRAAVWKAIKVLRENGYPIDAATNRGYCLLDGTDILSPQGMYKYLEDQKTPIDIQVLTSLDSTNVYVKKEANDGASEGLTVLSMEQTLGRGRLGRPFYSPANSGIYMSILLRPTAISATKAVHITTMAAVAVCEAIESCSREKPSVKWVNDIFVKGKKVCGILTEASFSLESGTVDYAVLGIGLNLYTPKGGFPENLDSVAGALFEGTKNDMKNKMAAEILNRFFHYYENPKDASYTDAYRKYSNVIGKKITAERNGETVRYKVLNIDDDCHLVVRTADGRTETLTPGEIRILL